MTSYKTLLFGTIAFVCAASPALADSASAVPKKMDSASAVPKTMDSASAVPKKMDSASAVPKKMDSASAVPKGKFLILPGVAGTPSLTLDLSWFESIIGH